MGLILTQYGIISIPLHNHTMGLILTQHGIKALTFWV